MIRAELDALKNGRGGYGEQIQAAKAVYNQLRSEKDNLIQQRNQITAKLKSTLDKKDASIKSQRSLRSTLKFSTEEDFNAEINKLRHQQETRSMSLNEEKRLIKEIEVLQQQKQHVSKVSAGQGAVDQHNDNIKDSRALQAAKNAEIDVVQEKMTAQKLVLDELYKANDEEKKQDKFPALAKERKDIKEQLDAKFTTLKELRKNFKEANNKYYDNIRLVRKKKELERQKEEEQRKAEYEAKLADYEKEMAKIHPYQDEMDLCDALVSFLEKTFAKELNEEEDAKKEATSAPVELEGLKVLKRKDEDYIIGGGGKKKGKKPAKKTKKDAKLSLPISQLDAFSTVGLMPPSTVVALTESLTAIKAKKVWFDAQTSRPKAEVVAAPAAAAKSSPKKKSNKKFSAEDQSAFPTLGGAEAAAPQEFSGALWGPGIGASLSVPTDADFPVAGEEEN